MSKLLQKIGKFDRFVPQLHLGYVRESATGTLYCFKLDTVQNYRGESPKQLGLEAGTPVRFDADAEGRVVRLQVVPKATAAAAS